MRPLLLSLGLLLAFSASSRADVVFSSGTLPDLSDTANYNIADATPTPLVPIIGGWATHRLLPGTLTEPVTVRCIEFYGYTQGVTAVPADHGFTIIVDGLRIPLAIRREVVAAAPFTNATPVYRYLVDVFPFSFTGNQIFILADTALDFVSGDWYWAKNDVADVGIEQSVYSDPGLTTSPAVSVGASNAFVLHDEFLVLPPSGVEITSFTRVSGTLFEVSIRGGIGTDYELRSSTILDFQPGTLVENLTQGDSSDPGTLSGSSNQVVRTDASGDATVRLNLSGTANFVVARERE